MPWLHWAELVLISMAAAMYTMAEAGQSGAAWNWEGAWMALAKSSMVSMTSVFCEHIYKSNKFVIVLLLQIIWSFLCVSTILGVALSGVAFHGIANELVDAAGETSLFSGGPALNLCGSAEHLACI